MSMYKDFEREQKIKYFRQQGKVQVAHNQGMQQGQEGRHTFCYHHHDYHGSSNTLSSLSYFSQKDSWQNLVNDETSPKCKHQLHTDMGSPKFQQASIRMNYRNLNPYSTTCTKQHAQVAPMRLTPHGRYFIRCCQHTHFLYMVLATYILRVRKQNMIYF